VAKRVHAVMGNRQGGWQHPWLRARNSPTHLFVELSPGRRCG
jgi:hypothetical protein